MVQSSQAYAELLIASLLYYASLLHLDPGENVFTYNFHSIHGSCNVSKKSPSSSWSDQSNMGTGPTFDGPSISQSIRGEETCNYIGCRAEHVCANSVILDTPQKKTYFTAVCSLFFTCMKRL